MAIDARFSQFIRSLLSNSISFRDHYKVGELPLEIDMILHYKDSTKLNTLIENGLGAIASIFKFSDKKYIVGEYKSKNDNHKRKIIFKLQAYRFLFIDRELKKNPMIDKDITSLLILTKKMDDYMYPVRKMDKGIYSLKTEPEIYVIVINELEIKPSNYGLLNFSTDDKLLEFIGEIIKSKDSIAEQFISFAYIYNYKEFKMVVTQENLDEFDIAAPIRDFGIKKAIDQIGLDEVIAAVGLDEVIATVGLDEVIAAVGVEILEKALQKHKDRMKSK